MADVITDFLAVSAVEGPQIVLTWTPPDDPAASDIKILKKLRSYSNDITDGSEILSEPVSLGTDHLVDLNPTPYEVWCYTGFTKLTISTAWAGSTAKNIEAKIIPTTPNGYFYECTQAGVTGSSEPTWPTTLNSVVEDGTVIWKVRAANPGWITTARSRDATFTWDSEYMQNLLFRLLPEFYRTEDSKSNLVALSPQSDPEDNDIWRAIHDDGTVLRGEFQRFLMLFGILASRMKGATDFYPKLVDPDETLPQYLGILGGLLGWFSDFNLPVLRQRAEIFQAVPTYKRKGTVPGLEGVLRESTDVANVVVDPMNRHILMSNRLPRLSAQGVLGLTYPTWAATTGYSRGDVVLPTDPNKTGYYYQAFTAGASGGAEPTWPTAPGNRVTDGSVVWIARQFATPRLTVDASPSDTSLTVTDSSIFEVGRTVNLRDSVASAGEELVIEAIPDSVTVDLESPVQGSYTVADDAELSYAFDWFDDETGFSWDLPVFDSLGNPVELGQLYTFEMLRLWFLLQTGEVDPTTDPDTLARIARIMQDFAPADTRYVIRVEGP